MKKVSLTFWSSVASSWVLLSSCASLLEASRTELQPGAEKVRFFMTEQRNCKFISELTARYEESTPYEETEEKARNIMKNEAHGQGANAIILISIDRKPRTQTENQIQPGYTKIFGNAYQCRF